MKVIFGEAAKVEFEKAIEWYETEQKGLGERFAQSIIKTVNRISIFPEFSISLTKGIRRALVKSFPYGVIYSVKSDYVEIIAIAHLHRKPMYWNKSKK